MLRRAETSPSAAIDELTRDIARIRGDLDDMRQAVSTRSRHLVRDTGERLSQTAHRTAQDTRRFVRRHPGTSTGIGLGVLAVLAGLLWSLSLFRR